MGSHALRKSGVRFETTLLEKSKAVRARPPIWYTFPTKSGTGYRLE